mmetsp:Transcript_23372/g.65162  ORF Transcript_23372/g.65162 Transcript_23372/m.65162 type:complete len:206 (-) Transcript_23372:3-620(-)
MAHANGRHWLAVALQIGFDEFWVAYGSWLRVHIGGRITGRKVVASRMLKLGTQRRQALGDPGVDCFERIGIFTLQALQGVAPIRIIPPRCRRHRHVRPVVPQREVLGPGWKVHAAPPKLQIWVGTRGTRARSRAVARHRPRCACGSPGLAPFRRGLCAVRRGRRQVGLATPSPTPNHRASIAGGTLGHHRIPDGTEWRGLEATDA